MRLAPRFLRALFFDPWSVGSARFGLLRECVSVLRGDIPSLRSVAHSYDNAGDGIANVLHPCAVSGAVAGTRRSLGRPGTPRSDGPLRAESRFRDKGKLPSSATAAIEKERAARAFLRATSN